MSQTKSQKLEKESLDLLMKEYDHLAESYFDEKRKGVTRFNLFLAIISAMVALIGWKGLTITPETTEAAASLAEKQMLLIFVCLLVGFFTLSRIIRRDLTSDKYLSGLAKIRAYFVEQDPNLVSYLAFNPKENPPPRERQWKNYFKVELSGLVEMVSMINSLMFGWFCVFLAKGVLSGWAWSVRGTHWASVAIDAGVFVLGAAAAWFLQFVYVRWRFADKTKQSLGEG